MGNLSITPLVALKYSRHLIPSHTGFPNTSVHSFPLLICRSVFPQQSLTSSSVSAHLAEISVVKPQWTYPMYTQHHYHSTTHELLVVLTGSADICFGGPDNPDRVETKVEKGDVMIIPAGVAHAMRKGSDGFMMLGCYPVGAQQWDHCTGHDKGAEERIGRLKWFERDPIYGSEGGPVFSANE